MVFLGGCSHTFTECFTETGQFVFHFLWVSLVLWDWVSNKGLWTREACVRVQHSSSWFWQWSPTDPGIHQWGSTGSSSGDSEGLLSREQLKISWWHFNSLTCDLNDFKFWASEEKKLCQWHQINPRSLLCWIAVEFLQVPHELRCSQIKLSVSQEFCECKVGSYLLT